MNESDHNIPDDFWRKAFEEAAETPPPRVWDAVERRLNEADSLPILPLWGTGLAASRPIVWRSAIAVAAAVALLLVGWWIWRPATPQQVLARRQPVLPSGNIVPGSPVHPEKLITSTAKASRPTSPLSPEILPAENQPQATIVPNQKSVSVPRVRQAPAYPQLAKLPVEAPAQTAPVVVAAAQKPANKQRITRLQPTLEVRPAAVSDTPDTHLSNERVGVATSGSATANTVLPTQENAPAPTVSVLSAVVGPTLSFEPVLGITALNLRKPGAIQRIVWFQPADLLPDAAVAMAGSKRPTREVWAWASLMPGMFNPSVALQPAQSSFAQANKLSNTNQPSINSRASFSVAYQTGAGIQLTEHWSIESGVGYLAARSVVDSPVQASGPGFISAIRAGQTTNLYADALRNNSQNAITSADITPFRFSGNTNSNYPAQSNYNPQERQLVTNDYQYVQVPLQIGYQLRPRKRLSMALLGGFLSNIFIRNTVGNDLVITTKDRVYRPVSWLATVGARLRYRPSKQWSASLAGMYQPSLGLSTLPESTVQTRPTQTGMSFGINYHF